MQPTSSNNIKIELIDKQIKQQELIIERSQNTLTLLDKTLEKYIDLEYVTRGLKRTRKTKRRTRKLLHLSINNASDKIAELTDKKSNYQLEQDKIEQSRTY